MNPHLKETFKGIKVLFWRATKTWPQSSSSIWKTSCFWTLKTQLEQFMQRQVDNVLKTMLQAIILGKVEIASIIHSDGWSGYDGLVDIGFKKALSR